MTFSGAIRSKKRKQKGGIQVKPSVVHLSKAQTATGCSGKCAQNKMYKKIMQVYNGQQQPGHRTKAIRQKA
jgi:hypothetical protein